MIANKAHLLLGSNMGDSKSVLQQAKKDISASIGRIIISSSFYTTAAWGKEDQPDFINEAVLIETNFSAADVLKKALEIERKAGRKRTEKYGARIIDIDIIFFNEEIIQEEGLTVPHPHMQNRRFVLEPLNEIAPSYRHPVLRKTIAEILTECSDPLNVQKI